MITEKRLRPNEYDIGPWNNDTGYMTGWDGDTMTMAFRPADQTPWPPLPDTNPAPNECCSGSRAGSAHPSAMISVLADGAVRPISYQIDFPTYVALLYRRDNQAIEVP
jgi:hypothetical protein